MIRKGFWFDDPTGEGYPGRGEFHPCRFAVSDGGDRLYMEGGASAGFRLLVVRDPDDRVGTAAWLHASVTAEVTDSTELRGILRRWADAIPEPERLVPIAEVPGFGPATTGGRMTLAGGRDAAWHQQGWWTRTEYALPLPPPAWAPEASAWDIAEGVYLRFPDESIRLVRKPEYYAFLQMWGEGGVKARQGDLLALGYSGAFIQKEAADGAGVAVGYLDRHKVEVVAEESPPADGGMFAGYLGTELHGRQHIWLAVEVEGRVTVTHPQHELLRVEGPCVLVLAPGTSLPFALRGGGGLD